MNGQYENVMEIKKILEEEFNEELIVMIAAFALTELHSNDRKNIKNYLEKLREKWRNSVFGE